MDRPAVAVPLFSGHVDGLKGSGQADVPDEGSDRAPAGPGPR